MNPKVELSESIIDLYQKLLNDNSIKDNTDTVDSALRTYSRILDLNYIPSQNTTNAFLKVLEACSKHRLHSLDRDSILVIKKAGIINKRNDLVITIMTNHLYWAITKQPEICNELIDIINEMVNETCPYLIVVRAYYQITQYFVSKKNFDSCKIYLDKIKTIIAVVKDYQILYYYYLSLGNFHFVQGELYKTIYYLSKVIYYKDSAPDLDQYYRAHYLLALSYASNSIMDKAIHHIDILLNNKSGYNKDTMLIMKSRMLTQSKQYPEAEEILLKLRKSNPSNQALIGKVNVDLFMSALMQDDKEKIENSYKKLNDVNIKMVHPLFLNYYYIHVSQPDKVDIEKIIKDYQETETKHNPFAKQYLYFLLEYFIKNKDYLRAYKQLQLLKQKLNSLEVEYKKSELESYLELLESYETFNNNEASKREFVSSIKQEKLEKSLIGKTLAFRKVIGDCKIIANAHFSNVLITGETGTGKEMIAKLIHYNSNRKSNDFCELNLTAMSSSLIESELFGYKKGAFTGALQDKKGLLEIVHNGTLFLDEISEIPLDIQAKLLKVVEEKSFYPVGSTKPVSSNFRLICASNQDLLSLTESNQFRLDLYYRISNYEIKLPTLRDRKDDIPLITKHFVEYYCGKLTKPSFELNDEQISRLLSYDYPGNIRELKNLIQRIVICFHSGQSIDQVISDSLRLKKSPSQLQSFNLEEIEKKTIISALKEVNGIQSKAARLLGISNNAIARKITKYDLRNYCN